MRKRQKVYSFSSGILRAEIKKDEKDLYLLSIKEIKELFREHLEWFLTLLIMIAFLFSFIGLVLVLDTWFSHSVLTKKDSMNEYVNILRGEEQEDKTLTFYKTRNREGNY